MEYKTSLVDFLAGRAGTILLTATIFMFLLGLHASGHGSQASDQWMSGFGGALLGALSSELRTKTEPSPKP